MVNNILFCYEGDKLTGNESERKQHLLQHKMKHGSSMEAYKGGSKSTERKVGYAAVFTDTTRRGIKEIKEREDIRWLVEPNAGH